MRALRVPGALLGPAALAALVGLGACIDPIQQRNVEDLGGETDGIRPGPRHRAGQPCLVCHNGEGLGGPPHFSVAGTVYAQDGSTQGAQGVTVTMTDAKNKTVVKTTNDVGNFYVQFSEWDPAFPLKVKIGQGTLTQEMQSVVGGTGSCADCHKGTKGSTSSMPAVYLKDAP